MNNKEYGKYYLICDYCGTEVQFDTFDELVDYKKDNKWRSIFSDGDWQDHCPDCVKKVYEGGKIK